MKIFTPQDINQLFDYQEFVNYLHAFYRKEVTTPERSHYEVNDNPKGTMLLMPSWGSEAYMGVKLVNVFPDNKDIPSINGIYVLMSKQTGEILAQFDGLTLTCKRTAAVSALAAKLLRKESMKNMLMIGTGNMSEELIKAHHQLQEFNNIGIWGRDLDKTKLKALKLKKEGYPVTAVIDKDVYATRAALISVATLAEKPILFGADLRSDVYVDLVGSYQKHSREADDAVIRGAKIYVDTYTSLRESGELKLPIESGLVKKEDVLADIIALSALDYESQHGATDKIVFKSVGFAASDLAAASYLYAQEK